MGAFLDDVAAGLAKGHSRRDTLRGALGVGAAAAVSSLLRPRAARAATKPTFICTSPAPPPRGSCPLDESFPWIPGCAGGTTEPAGVASTYNGCGPEGGIDGTDPVPDQPLYLANFFPACAGHDCCYGTCQADKTACDGQFLADLTAICERTYAGPLGAGQAWGAAALLACLQMAAIYFDFVYLAGGSAYLAAQGEACICCCPNGQKYCGTQCIDVQSDPNNCGGCGAVCDPPSICVKGSCTCGGATCAAPNVCCNQQCVDLQTDPSNCGTCGNACATGQICSGGQCGCAGQPCSAPNACCNQQCVDLQTDVTNCGTCGNVCPPAEMCTGGQCTCGGTVCASNETCCSGSCVDLQTDPNNCGACANPCGSGLTCCSGTCVNTNTDPDNCGVCGNVCP